MNSRARHGTVRIGISGFRYAPFRGVFYPRGLRARDELAYAMSKFSTLEINGSFYSLQRPEYYSAWRDAAPTDAVFAVKGGRFITHMKRLRGVDGALANFFASGVLCLGSKLGPLLWQLPASLRFDHGLLADFLQLLPKDTRAARRLAKKHDAWLEQRVAFGDASVRPIRHALEVRSETFATPAFLELLRAHEIALVIADTAERFPVFEELTTDFMYLRLHGDKQLYASGYTEKALASWARRIDAWQRTGRDVYAYFDNDSKVHAPFDAMLLARMVASGNFAARRRAAETRPRLPG